MAKRRSNGDGSIYRDNEGNWIAQIAIGKNEKGATKYKHWKNKKQKVVKDKLNEYKSLMSQGVQCLDNICLDLYILAWLNNVKKNTLKPTSFDRAKCTIECQIIKRLGFYKISELSSELIQIELINKMKDEGLSFSSINKAYVYLNSCLEYALGNRKLLFNPCKTVVLPSKDKFEIKEIRFFNDIEIAKFKDSALLVYPKKKETMIYDYGYAFVLDIYLGLRIGELIALKWGAVDFVKKSININKSIVSVNDYKNLNENGKPKMKALYQDSTKSQNRNIQLCKTAISILHILKGKDIEATNDDYIFSKNGKPPTGVNMDKTYANICKRAGLDSPCGVHTLRHTFASLLFRKGVDVKTVSILLGHKDVSFTYNTYIHIIDEQKQTAIALLDEV